VVSTNSNNRERRASQADSDVGRESDTKKFGNNVGDSIVSMSDRVAALDRTGVARARDARRLAPSCSGHRGSATNRSVRWQASCHTLSVGLIGDDRGSGGSKDSGDSGELHCDRYTK